MTKQEKGVFGGICGTPGCDRPARWIPIPDVNRGGDMYRCTVCCDAIRAVQGARVLHVATYTSTSARDHVLDWDVDRIELIRSIENEGWFEDQKPGDVIAFHVVPIEPGSSAPPLADTEALTEYLISVTKL